MKYFYFIAYFKLIISEFISFNPKDSNLYDEIVLLKVIGLILFFFLINKTIFIFQCCFEPK